MNRLRKGEICPLHKSFYCCGRANREKEFRKKTISFDHGVRKVADEFHPRGYREICSESEKRRRKHVLMADGKHWRCFYCGKDLRQLEYVEIDLCHIEPKGSGGARHDDHYDNLTLGCHDCNVNNGSKRPGLNWRNRAQVTEGK